MYYDDDNNRGIYRLELCISTITATKIPSLQHCVEAEVLHDHYAILNRVISTNPDVFGSHVVQEGFTTQPTVNDIVNTVGFTNYKKASQLLNVVECRFKTTSSRELARDFFNKLVLIVANHLNRDDIAKNLIATYSESVYQYGT